jgi:hypothetical protein
MGFSADVAPVETRSTDPAAVDISIWCPDVQQKERTNIVMVDYLSRKLDDRVICLI